MTRKCPDIKKLFLISATGKVGSPNRIMSDVLLDLLNRDNTFNENYTVVTHVNMNCENLYDSLDEAIRGDDFEGYLILLDTLDTSRGLCNPNVMFEFGAIKNLGKPFAVMAINSRDTCEYPFDVDNINVAHIPPIITNYVKDSLSTRPSKNVVCWRNELPARDQNEIEQFFYKLYNNYVVSVNRKNRRNRQSITMCDKLDALIDTHETLKTQIEQLTISFNNTAEYIDGESNAFSALSTAVRTAKHSLRTSRFANQSIVRTQTREQKEFMEALYAKSEELKENFFRIICNNHPAKWFDIYNILYHGGNGSRVYVRKSDYSIYFELVIIDESIAFVHFYQQDRAKITAGNLSDYGIEKINSTLQIRGSSICHKFANIFDRLHHRDFEKNTPTDPSRTLLGIPQIENYSPDLSKVGFFEMPENCSKSASVRNRKILDMFEKAFLEWDIHGKDKLNMAVGIALLEESPEFLEEMHIKTRLDDKEYSDALELYTSHLNVLEEKVTS